MKISLVEYKNIIDENGIAVGHGTKVMKQFAQLLTNLGYEVEIVAACPYTAHFNEYVTQNLPYANMRDFYNYKIINKIFRNIFTAVSHSSSDAVWFTNIDIFILLYLGIFDVKKKVIISAYENYVEKIARMQERGPIKQAIANIASRGLSKIDLYTYSYHGGISTEKMLYIPDFIYSEEKYASFKSENKKDQVVCVGTIDGHKNILGLIDCFKNLNIQLLISGLFTNKELLYNTKASEYENIIIDNRYLSENEYTKLISESKYVIVPYFTEQYQCNRTSGVLLEAIYLGATVIAPSVLLKSMHLNGFGYNDLSEVRNFFIKGEKFNAQNDLSEYREGAIVPKLKEALDSHVFK